MKKISLLIAFVGILGTLIGQDTSEVYTLVEEMPIYPGCEAMESNDSRNECTINEIVNFIATHTKYPKKAKRKNVDGTVYIQFIVDEFGNVGNVDILKGVNIKYGDLLNQEALRVISKLPQMKAGKQKGEVVRVQYSVPIRFNLGKKPEK
jgi:protein TonB